MRDFNAKNLKKISLNGKGNWEFGNIPGNAPAETGGNRELNPKNNRERAGTGNIIFEKIGNRAGTGNTILENREPGGNREHNFWKIGNGREPGR